VIAAVLKTGLAPARHQHECVPRTLDPAHAVEHVDALYRAACALTGSAHEAEDLVQETYSRVLAKPRVLHSISDRGYLLIALRRTFLDDHRRKRRRALQTPLDDMEVEIADPSPRGQPQDALDARELYSAIAALPDGWGEVVAAVDIAGLTYSETARLLDVPEGTVMSRLYRARRRLAAQLDEESS
jgi:RNA polymerase sigma-70 factor (ECF subfamily)